MLTLTTSLSDSFNEYNQIVANRDKKESSLSGACLKEQKQRFSFKRVLRKITVEPVTFCYACALILHAPLIQQYVYHRVSQDHGLPSCINNDVSSCELSTEAEDSKLFQVRKDVQSMTSYIYLGIILSASLPSLVMALLLGSWSDKVGRKIVIILPVIGGLLESTCIIVTIFTRAPLYVLCVGSFMNGLCGFFTTMILAVFSYIADITEEKERALRLGILEAVAFTSGMISHMTSGWWIRHLGFKAPYIFIFCLHATSFLYTLFFLKDTTTRREELRFKDLFDWKHFSKVFGLFQNAVPTHKMQLYGLVLTSAFMMISNIGFGSVIVLYALDTPFCFSPIMIGYFLADCMFMQALGAIFALILLQRFLSEILLTELGIISTVSSLVTIALITQRWQMFLVPIVGCFGGVCMPVIRARMSKLVQADQQGSLFAAVATLETLCTLFGAAIFNSLYPYSVKQLDFKGLCFLIMAALLLIPAVIIAMLGICSVKTIDKDEIDEKLHTKE
ncbi:proton-coupled folate transporter-like [Hydractinia symbiolongicarpus]|uniref:proton-coupled folate transporter-like n=1 Tax=Hydractinia symbiolongicarpus TaxID=13093 RepID=UPI00254C90DD|nr:proton-coupled folate transporter-like [Hydractinia symbiolongicarpus]